MLRNNNFARDTQDVRSERADLMTENIDALAGDLGLIAPSDLLTWARNVGPNWANARSTASTENAQDDEAFQEYHIQFQKARGIYQEYKELLLAIISDLQQDDEIVEEYGIKGRTPRTRESLNAAIQDWRKTHDLLVAAGDSRVVPEAYVAEIESEAAAYDDLWHAAKEEQDEARRATAAKEELFAEDTDKFRILYRMAVIAFGKDGSQLRLLGFVPASEIWTPGDPDPTLPEWMEPIETYQLRYLAPVDMVQHTYSSCQGAETCRIEIRPEGATEWELVIEGLTMIPEDIIPYRSPSPGPGIWEYRITPINSGGEYGEPKIATVEIP